MFVLEITFSICVASESLRKIKCILEVNGNLEVSISKKRREFTIANFLKYSSKKREARKLHQKYIYLKSSGRGEM